MRRLPLAAALLIGALLAPGAETAAAEEGPSAEVLAGLASSSAARREQALARLGRVTRWDGAAGREAVRRLCALVRRRPAAEGARAVRLLARIPLPEARAAWLRALDADASAEHLLAALDSASLRARDAATQRLLLARVRDRRAPPAARALALEALAATGGPGADLVLRRPLGHPRRDGWLLASARARGLGRRGGPEAVPLLLDLLDHPDPAPRVHAWESLVTLTGRSLPARRAAWQAWLQAEEEGRPPGPAAADAVPADRYGALPPAHVPTYYGIPLDRPASRVVFCLDVSQSMYGRGIEQARAELERTIRDLPSTYAFEVLAFNERVTAWAGRLRPAHPVLKARALAWLAGLETISYTNLYDAVETAFGYAGTGARAAPDPAHVDAIFLLSDGAPNRGRYRREDRVVSAIAALSQRRVPVHCIAAGEEVFPLLRRVASATGGRFVDAFEFD